MKKFIDAVRVSTCEAAIWRLCQGCGLLAALPPQEKICHACQPTGDTDRQNRARKEQSR